MTDLTEKEKADLKNVTEEIEKLSELDPLQYELKRQALSEKYHMRVCKLDELFESKRKKHEEKQSETLLFPEILPWKDPISVADLLNEIVSLLNKYVSFISKHQPRAIALWVIHTYCIEAAYISPILFVTSAEMRSGKSTLLAILQKIVSKCIAASSVSSSVIFRIIPKHHPTLIFDEADTYVTDKNEDMRGILNAGHSRDTSKVLRTNPDTLEPEIFDAFGPKCIAGIKGLPCTVEDRSIIIKMQRMKQGQKKEKMRLIDIHLRQEFINIQRKCIKFANEKTTSLRDIKPTIPDEINDRAADNWHPLFQIADLAGNEWIRFTTDAALYLSGHKQENKSLGIELLEDIRDLFDGKFKDKESIPTFELINALAENDESPWANFNPKKQDTQINARQLAKLLEPYDIKSINNIGDQNRKGYLKSSFEDAFSRYIYSETTNFTELSALAAQPRNDASSEENMTSAPIRSHPLLVPEIGADSGWGRHSERHAISRETAPDKARADGADKTAKLSVPEEQQVDYVEV